MKPCWNFKQGHCRFGMRCKFSHQRDSLNVLQDMFPRIEIGSRPHESVKVGLDSEKERELREFLNINTHEEQASLVYHQTLTQHQGYNDEAEEEDDDDDDDDDEDDESDSCSHSTKQYDEAFENMLQEKYAHIPNSTFKHIFLENIRGNHRASSGNMSSVKCSLERDFLLDLTLKRDLQNKEKSSPMYQKMAELRKRLPIYKCKERILNAIEENSVIVISGETGSGKTTQVAQFILDDYIMNNKGSLCHIVCTQPRRISAVSVAERVARERDEICGKDNVGYQIRLNKKLPRAQGSIVFCTTGILLQWMHSDPGVRNVSHVLIDEVHERNIDSDFVMTILREILCQRQDLKVIIMSATLNSELFSKYFNNCPFIEVPGFIHPVTECYMPDILQMTGYVKDNYRKPQRNTVSNLSREQFFMFIVPYVKHLFNDYGDIVVDQLLQPAIEDVDLNLIMNLIQYICYNKPAGAILVFLPGWETISKLCIMIQENEFFNADKYKSYQEIQDEREESDGEGEEDGCEESACSDDDLFLHPIMRGEKGSYLVMPLHSKLPTVNQSQVFDTPPPSVRKIIISTNIAETSITINDVVYIIDCGKMKVKKYDPEQNLSNLQDEWVSKANAEQRKGRAGRCQPGICYRLYTKARLRLLDEFPAPEILRTRLEELILTIKLLQLGRISFILSRVMDCPKMNIVNNSIKLLQTLKALDEDENLTPLGFHLAKLPLDPHVGKMIILGAIFSCLNPILSIAACLSFKEPFVSPMGCEKELVKKKTQLSMNTKSDHLVLAEIIKRWEKRGKRSLRKFYKENFVSPSTLHSIRDLKIEFVDYLYEMGFLQNKILTDYNANMNSEDLILIKGIICAGLYPNVAIIKRVSRYNISGKREIDMYTPEGESVKLHRTSINESMEHFESPYLMYHNKMKSSFIFLHDTTMVSSLPLILFSHKVEHDASRRVIHVNKHIVFNCDKKTAESVQKLKEEIQKVLDKIYMNPGTVDWKSNDKDSRILRAAVELMQHEVQQMTGSV